MKRFLPKRRLPIVLIVGLVILVGLGFAVRVALHSRQVASMVTSRLEAMYGGSVHVADVSVGLSSSSVTGVELFDKGKADSQDPWLTIDAISANVSALELLRGRVSANDLTLTGVAIKLRFDKDGHLLTQLPRPGTADSGAEVTLHIERGRITLQKEGGDELVITGIDATLTSTPNQVTLTGSADNADQSTWGKWTLQGSLDQQSQKTLVTLKSAQSIHLTQAMLNQLPFVPARIWRAVQADGDTLATITLQSEPADPVVHYRIELEPRATELHVPAIDLDATGVSGKLVIDDGLLQLREVQGQAFGGTIHTTADLDFRGAVTRFRFSKVEVQGLNAQSLPASWGVPPHIDGRLKGKASFSVDLEPAQLRTRGEGQGEIEDARIGGQPTAEAVRLELHAQEGRFGIRNPPMDAPGNRPDIIPQRKADAPGPMLDVSLKMREVDLALLIQGLGVTLPFSVSGRLTYDFGVSIPFDTRDDLKTYRVKGSFQVVRLGLGNIHIDDLRGLVNYADGILALPEMAGRLAALSGKGSEPPAGIFRGTARLPLIPLGELTADLSLDKIPLSRAAALVGAKDSVSGDLFGTVAARAPGAKLQEVDAWEATAKITAGRVQAFGLTIQDGQAEVHLLHGLLSLADVQTRIEGTPVTGSAEVRMTVPYRFNGRVALQGGDLAAIQRLGSEMRPPVSLAGQLTAAVDVQGTLQPPNLLTTGAGTIADLKVDDVHVQKSTVAWESSSDQLTLKEFHADLYEGTVDGSAVIPLRLTTAGSANLRMKALDVGSLGKALAALPFSVDGRVEGTLKGTLMAAEPGKRRAVSLVVDLKAPNLRLQGIPTESLQGEVAYDQGTVNYRFMGKSLGGDFELDGQMPPLGTEPAKKNHEGHLRVKQAHLSRVGAILQLESDALPLHGLADVEIKFRHEGLERIPVGNGRFNVTRPRWGDTVFTERLHGDILLTGKQLQLREVTAHLGEGILRAQFAFNLHQLDQSRFTLHLERAEAARVLQPWPALAGLLEGQFEAHLSGRLGRRWSGTGDLYMGRGKVRGVEIAEWRLPLTWTLVPSEGRGEIALSETNALLAQGRAVGRATLIWETGLRLEGDIRFFNMELRTLLRQATDSTQFGNGRVTGQFSFVGTQITSLDDLTGTLTAALAQTQAFQFPVLQQLAPFLGIQPASTFDSGEISARLARGRFQIQKLALQGPFLQVNMDGIVALSGRLDLEVTRKIGLTPGINVLSSPPLRLEVTGTVRNPAIRIKPLSLLVP